MQQDVVNRDVKARTPREKRSRRRHHKRRRGLPAPLVFYSVLLAAAAAAALTYLGGPAFAAFAACLIIGYALFVNDREGFIKSKKMRRAFSPRTHFTQGEQLVLIVLLLINAFVGISAFF